MSDYTKSVDFAAKDSLPTGNPSKIAKGTEVDTEFTNIATAIATKYDAGDIVLHADGNSTTPGIAFNSETGMGFYRQAAGTMTWTSATAGAKPLMIELGALRIQNNNGSAASPSSVSVKPLVVAQETFGCAGTFTSFASAPTSCGQLVMAHSRGTTVGTVTALSNADTMGMLMYCGVNTSPAWVEGARIECRVDGSPTSTNVPTNMLFWTMPTSGSMGERMRITPAGKVLMGTQSENTGGAILQVKDGLTFPATQVTSTDVNTLDDYEEGTWTPVFTFATPGNLTIVYTEQLGNYIKIGKTVFYSFGIVTSTFTHTTASGQASITGLPFTVLNAGGMGTTHAMEFQNITKASYTQFMARPKANATSLELIAGGSGQASIGLAATEFPTGGTLVLRGGGFFINNAG